MVAWVVVCGVACAGLLVADRRSSRAGVWVCKPVAAAAFVGAALWLGALESGYGQLVLAALCLCWLGDVLLIPRERPKLFLAGIGSFLAGHAVFGVAFALRGVDSGTLILWGIGGALAGAAALWWLAPHVAGVFRWAVPAYTIVIMSMVALAAATALSGGPVTILAGALMFAISDVSVARNRFVAPGFANGAWGLPLYFGAQLVLASTVASLPPS